MGLFGSSKKKKKNNQKFINTDMIANTDEPQETFVYQTVENQNMNFNNYNQNYSNQQNNQEMYNQVGYQDNNMNQNYYQNQQNSYESNNQYNQEIPENYNEVVCQNDNLNLNNQEIPQNYNQESYIDNSQVMAPTYEENYNEQPEQLFEEKQEESQYDNSNYELEQLEEDNNQVTGNLENTNVEQNISENINREEQIENSVEELGEVEEVKLDPLNNANNPIPVNPTAPKEEQEDEEIEEEARAGLFSVIGIIIGMILRPGTTILKNTKKYKKTSKGIAIFIWLFIITILGCIATSVITGACVRTYNSVTGSYNVILNFANVVDLNNYYQPLIIAFFISFVAILIISLLFYATSFFNSKGINFGTYLMIAIMGMIPTILGVVVLSPLIAIISPYLSIIILAISIVYSIICFIVGTNSILKFKNANSQIIYNTINLSILITIVLIVFFIGLQTGIIVLPEL